LIVTYLGQRYMFVACVLNKWQSITLLQCESRKQQTNNHIFSWSDHTNILSFLKTISGDLLSLIQSDQSFINTSLIYPSTSKDPTLLYLMEYTSKRTIKLQWWSTHLKLQHLHILSNRMVKPKLAQVKTFNRGYLRQLINQGQACDSKIQKLINQIQSHWISSHDQVYW
jgi:hypothetical protein